MVFIGSWNVVHLAPNTHTLSAGLELSSRAPEKPLVLFSLRFAFSRSIGYGLNSSQEPEPHLRCCAADHIAFSLYVDELGIFFAPPSASLYSRTKKAPSLSSQPGRISTTCFVSLMQVLSVYVANSPIRCNDLANGLSDQLTLQPLDLPLALCQTNPVPLHTRS